MSTHPQCCGTNLSTHPHPGISTSPTAAERTAHRTRITHINSKRIASNKGLVHENRWRDEAAYLPLARRAPARPDRWPRFAPRHAGDDALAPASRPPHRARLPREAPRPCRRRRTGGRQRRAAAAARGSSPLPARAVQRCVRCDERVMGSRGGGIPGGPLLKISLPVTEGDHRAPCRSQCPRNGGQCTCSATAPWATGQCTVGARGSCAVGSICILVPPLQRLGIARFFSNEICRYYSSAVPFCHFFQLSIFPESNVA